MSVAIFRWRTQRPRNCVGHSKTAHTELTNKKLGHTHIQGRTTLLLFEIKNWKLISNKKLGLDLTLNQRPKYLKVRQLTLILSPCLSRANEKLKK